MTIAQQPRHRTAGAQGNGAEPHPSGPLVLTRGAPSVTTAA